MPDLFRVDNGGPHDQVWAHLLLPLPDSDNRADRQVDGVVMLDVFDFVLTDNFVFQVSKV